MRSSEQSIAPAPSERTGGILARAFGLDLELPCPMIGFEPAARPEGRRCEVRLVSSEEAAARWSPAEPEFLLNRRFPDGRAQLTVEADPRAGYRYWSESFGAFLISSAGDAVACAPETEDAARWQRFFIGQILPFVAPLQGLEVLHASSVRLGGRTLAFMGGSGAGKSSLAVQLMLAGGELVSDDVLTLEGGALAHPGPAVMGVRHSEVERMPADVLARLGQELARNEKEVLFAVDRAPGPSPVDALYFISRDSRAEELLIEERRDPALLLGCTFNAVLKERDRLERMLDVCLAITQSARVAQVTVPPHVDAGMLAERLALDADAA